jgi:thioredoxin 1
MAAVQDVNEQNFETEVLQSETPVLVDFWATWCAPCRMLSPTVDAVSQELAGRLKVVKVSLDDSTVLANRYGVRNIPTLLLFKDGKVVDQLMGVHKKQQLLDRYEPLL